MITGYVTASRPAGTYGVVSVDDQGTQSEETNPESFPVSPLDEVMLVMR